MSDDLERSNYDDLFRGLNMDATTPLNLEVNPSDDPQRSAVRDSDSPTSASRNDEQKQDVKLWNSTVDQKESLLGILSLLVTLLSMIVSLVILTTSDGKPVRSWTVEPSV